MRDRLARHAAPNRWTSTLAVLAAVLLAPPVAAQGEDRLALEEMRRIEGGIAPQRRIDIPPIEGGELAPMPDPREALRDLVTQGERRPQPLVMAMGCGDTRVYLEGETVRHNDASAAGLHADLRDAIDRFRREGREIMAIALTPDCRGGTVVARGASFTRNVGGSGPRSYYDTIRRLVDQENRTVYAVAFDPYDWARRKGYVIAHDGGLELSGQLAGDGTVAEDLRREFERLHGALSGYERARPEALSIALASRRAGAAESGFAIVTAKGSFTRNVLGAEPRYHSAVQEMDSRSRTHARAVAFNYPSSPSEERAWALSVGPCVITSHPGFDPCLLVSDRLHVAPMRPIEFPCTEQACPSNATPRQSRARLDITGQDAPPAWPDESRANYVFRACDPAFPLPTHLEDAVDVRWSIDGAVKLAHASCSTIVPHATSSAMGFVYLDAGHAIQTNGQIVAGTEERGDMFEGLVGAVSSRGRPPRPVGDVWIVAMGDSWSSGEGAPAYALSPPAQGKARWLYDHGQNCHVSPLSWPMIVADRLAAAHPLVQVTISHLGCSGAAMGERGMLVKGSEAMAISKGATQIDALKTAIARRGRLPDLVLVSIGGNDLGFAGGVEACLLYGCDGSDINDYFGNQAACVIETHTSDFIGIIRDVANVVGVADYVDDATDALSKACKPAPDALAGIELILADEASGIDLSARYRALQANLDALGIGPKQVVLVPYYDPTRNARGATGTCDIIEISQSCPIRLLPGYDKVYGKVYGATEDVLGPDLTDRLPSPSTNEERERRESYKRTRARLLAMVSDPISTEVGGLARAYLIGRQNSGALRDDFEMARERIIRPLTQYQRRIAAELGWLFAEEAATAFSHNGICAGAGRNVNGFCHAVRDQGDYAGAFHPNTRGHWAFGLKVADIVRRNAARRPEGSRSLAQALNGTASPTRR